ncbi:hypothetical protein [Patulibacter defluvii]|uniref:hypothetical protein n=1 Tax=Patulibacter defluvii TaxID=3095358 RepID=UPI002A756BA3|nr:hypothetical protein [Patulibacter sp. DM4]
MTKLDLVGVLTGAKQPFDEVKTVTCPLTQGVVDVLKPVLGASVGTLETIGCGDNAVDYQFVTKLKTPSGEIVRKQLALVAVPTKLNVDADPEPDVIGTISVINLSKFEIRIERLPDEKSELPLQVEALIDDPLNGGIPREHINVGYDARSTRAPQRWTATAELPKTAEGTTDIDIRVTQTGAGPELTTLGGLYDGSADRRTRPMGGRLKFAPAPSLSRVGLSFGPTRTVVRAGSGTPTALDATAVLDDGTSRKDIGVQLNALPETLSFALDDLGPDRRKITYQASAPVDRVGATYTDTAGGAVTTKVVANARRLPTGMTVEQTSAKSGSFTATGGTLGSVEAGFANGDPQLLDRDHPYVNVQTDGPVQSFAGRIDDLQSASFDAADGIVANLQLGDGPRKPLDAVVNTPDLDLNAEVSDLPRKIGFRFAPATGTINYDAFGETIQRITAKATAPQPLVGRATRVEGEIRDLPPKADIAITPGGNGIELGTTAPIGRAEALLSSGPDGGLQPDELGADVVDTKKEFVAHARIEGLQQAKLAIDKTPVTSPTGETVLEMSRLHGTLRIGKQPLALRYRSDDIQASAGIVDVPEQLEIGFLPREGKISYDAHGGTIDTITVDAKALDADADPATGPKPLLGRATRVAGTIRGLPAKADVVAAPGGGGVDLTTDAPIGQADVLLTSGPAGGLKPDELGVDLVNTPAAFVADARIKGLRQAHVAITEAPVQQEDGTTKNELQKLDARLNVAAQPIAVRYAADAACTDADPATRPTAGVCFDGDLSAVPDDVHVTFDRPAGAITYDASAPIDSLGARVESGTPLFGEARKIDARIDRLPKKVTVGFKPAEGFDDGVDVSTDERVGRIKAKITDGTTEAPALVDGQAKVGLRKLPGQFAIAAQLYEIAGGKVGLKSYAPDQSKPEETSTRVAAELHLGPRPDGSRQDVDLDFQADKPGDAVDQPLNLTGRIDGIPDDMTLNLDADQVKFTSSTKIPRVTIDARNLPQGKPGEDLKGKPQNVKATIEQIPTELTVDLKKLVISPNSALGRIDFELWDVGGPRAALPEDGRNKLDFDKRADNLHVQGRLLAGLREATLTLPSGDGAETGKLKVRTKFAADPAPLDVVMRSGLGIDRSRVELTASELKTEQEFQFIDRKGLRVNWASNEPGTDVHLGVSTEKVGTNLDISDLPTEAFICAVGEDDCLNGYVMSRFPLNGKLVEVPLSTTVRTQANGPLNISGQICLTPTDDDGNPNGAVYDSCIDGNARNRVELDQLEVQSMTFGVFTGDTPQRNEDGDGPEEDDLLLLHLVTDGAGIRARNINIRNTTAGKLNIIRAGWTGSHPNYVREGQPLYAIPRAPGLPPQFTLLADLSFPPTVEDSTNKINCGASHLVTTVQLPILGTTNIFPAAGWVTGVCG